MSLLLKSIEEVFRCIWTLVDHWRLCLTITPYHDVAVVKSLMLLRLLCVALVGVELWPINLAGKGLKVSINNEGSWLLLVPVLKGDHVFPPPLASLPS